MCRSKTCWLISVAPRVMLKRGSCAPAGRLAASSVAAARGGFRYVLARLNPAERWCLTADPLLSLWVCCRYNGATEVLKLPVPLSMLAEARCARRYSPFACRHADRNGYDKPKFRFNINLNPGKARLDANEREIDSDSLY